VGKKKNSYYFGEHEIYYPHRNWIRVFGGFILIQ